ncbi:MAG: type I-F CRISPR-associated protein Csy2 [Cellvibrio sp.]|nr:type I-F CRISPR-associated protein Csy2 [Cellvibrio sp.]
MSQYLVLSHIEVQNSNSIAGLTWGFPAITGFLGFSHALNRKVSKKFGGDYECELSGCAVISHSYHQHIYSNDGGYTFRFSQRKSGYTFKPKKKDGKQVDPSIIEEGKMNLTISLVIELTDALSLTTELIKQFENNVLDCCYKLRLAGGTILNVKHVRLLSANTQQQQLTMLRKIKRLLMPGFVLIDRSNYLQEHYQGLLAQHDSEKNEVPTQLDAWLDFCALKSKAIPRLAQGQTEPDDNTPADWQFLPKPRLGYLVPLMAGYKAISDLYEAGKVANTRDEKTLTCFVEAIHSVGEWKGVHSLESIEKVIWRYQYDGQWYLCKQNQSKINDENEPTELLNNNEELHQTLNFNDALKLF